MRDYALIYLNGVRREIKGREALMMFAEWLRKEAGLTGTKIVCAEGDCGACTVLRAYPKPKEKAPTFHAMNSCISTVAQLDGSYLVTVEGIQRDEDLSPVQKAMRDCHGSQCGYCTPGFVMALTAAFEKYDQLDSKLASNYLTGNLCRCTGYQPIIEAAISAKANQEFSIQERYVKKDATEDLLSHQSKTIRIQGNETVFFAPTSIEEALKFVGDHSEVRVLGAATDLGVQINKGKPLPKILLSLHLIRELYEIKSEKKGLTLGARVTLSEMRKAVETTNPEFSRFLDLFASPQIKNVATLVGNVANASPIGDTLPFLLVSDGKVHLASFDSKTNKIARREVPLSDFYLGYKKLALKSNELITHISFSAQKEMVKLYKVSSRKDLDISTVSAAFFMKLKEEGSQKTVEEIRIALGGVAATPIRVFDAEKEMIGQEISKEFFEKGANLLASQIKPLSDLRGSQAYRKVLVKNLFRKLGEEMLHG